METTATALWLLLRLPRLVDRGRREFKLLYTGLADPQYQTLSTPDAGTADVGAALHAIQFMY